MYKAIVHFNNVRHIDIQMTDNIKQLYWLSTELLILSIIMGQNFFIWYFYILIVCISGYNLYIYYILLFSIVVFNVRFIKFSNHFIFICIHIEPWYNVRMKIWNVTIGTHRQKYGAVYFYKYMLMSQYHTNIKFFSIN